MIPPSSTYSTLNSTIISNSRTSLPLMATLHTFSNAFLSSFFLGCLLCSCSYGGFITHYCPGRTDIDNPSTFQTALMDAFSDLVSASSISKSRRSSAGDGVIHASFNCWRNTPSQVCKRCVKSATKSIVRLCSGHQNAIVWNSDCTLHYTLFTDEQEKSNPWAWWYSVANVDEIINEQQFNDSLTSIMSSLINDATNSTTPANLYATGEVLVTILDTLYGMVECSPSENPKTCGSCLRAAMARLSGCCSGSRAAEVVMASCRLGYDLGPSVSRASLVGPFASSSFPISKSIANAKRK